MKYRVQVIKEVKSDEIFIIEAESEDEARQTAITQMRHSDSGIEWETTYSTIITDKQKI